MNTSPRAISDGSNAWRSHGCPRHLVYLLKQSPNERDAERFGINAALARGFHITILDLQALILPDVCALHSDWEPASGVVVRHISSWREFRSVQSIISNADLVISTVRAFGLCARSFLVFRMLARTQTPYLTFAPLVDPIFADRKLGRTFLRRAFAAVREFQLNDLAASILSRVPFSILGLSQAEYFVVNGRASLSQNQMLGSKSTVIKAHAHDYDIALNAVNKMPVERNQAVFLDQDLLFHPDFVAAGITPMEPAKYLDALNAAFEKIEKTLGLEIVIAAHPRSEPERTRRLFGSRRVVFGESARTVAESRLVLTHYSRSSNFAVLMNKPIRFLVGGELYDWISWLPSYIENLSKALGTEPLFYDDLDNMCLDQSFVYDAAAYAKYTENFIKSPNSPRKPYWNIVLDQIEADFGVADQSS